MEVTVLDGPVGTELSARGVDTALPLWSAAALLDRPEVVADIHRDYAAAGATVHTANTFRTRRRTMPDGWDRAARLAVRIAREAVPAGHRVAGSLAPLEDCYRPDLSPADPAPEHVELAAVLAEAGCDLLLCETFPHAPEALVAVEAAVATGLPTWLSLTAGPSADLMTVEALRDAARGGVDRGAQAVLVNCTPATECERFVEALAGLGVPFGAYANAGAADDAIGWRASPEPGAAKYARIARRWVALGATLVGGCCGTGPAHVAALAAMIGASR